MSRLMSGIWRRYVIKEGAACPLCHDGPRALTWFARRKSTHSDQLGRQLPLSSGLAKHYRANVV